MNRLLLAGAAVLAIAGLGSLGMSYRNRLVPQESEPAERPTLALVTSLPLVFGESLSLEGGGSPALTQLEQRYTVLPIGVTDSSSLKGHRLLLMAHPRAQPAEALVQLDQWVRSGGHLLLLADPRLDWPSDRPLGDKLRPPPAFADTGLLAHWGLSLSGPERPGPIRLRGDDHPIIYFSAGRFVSNSLNCELSRANIIAECAIGSGKVTAVADADFLNAAALESYGAIPENQVGELMALLETLETR